VTGLGTDETKSFQGRPTSCSARLHDQHSVGGRPRAPASRGSFVRRRLNVSSEESDSVADYVTAENNIFSNISATAIIEAYASAGTFGPHNEFTPNLFFGNATDFEVLKSPEVRLLRVRRSSSAAAGRARE
jgi:hypothetical protein